MYDLPKTSKAIFRDEKGFERSKEIMATLGNPQNTHKAIHVAGTSGKGSICYLVDSILRAHGKKTGMMVSPHVYDIRERIQINGQLVDKEKFATFANLMLSKLENFHPSYFEALTSLGFLITAQENIDYMIVETGFGGLWDTTNTISRDDKLSVISKIGYDHTAILGDSIEEIAAQKAGIVQKDSQVVVIDQSKEALDVINSYARTQNASIHVVPELSDYQSTNISLAKSVVKKLAEQDEWQFEEKLADAAISKTFIPGRFEKKQLEKHVIILDGAHNPQKLEALCKRLEAENISPVTFIFAIGARKDWKHCLKIIEPYSKRVISTEFFTDQSDVPHQAISAKEITEYCTQIDLPSYAHSKPVDAIKKALSYTESIVVTGSFYLIPEINNYLVLKQH